MRGSLIQKDAIITVSFVHKKKQMTLHPQTMCSVIIILSRNHNIFFLDTERKMKEQNNMFLEPVLKIFLLPFFLLLVM